MLRIYSGTRGKNNGQWRCANLNANWDKNHSIKDFVAILQNEAKKMTAPDMLTLQHLQTEFGKIRTYIPEQLSSQVDMLLTEDEEESPLLLRTDVDVNTIIKDLLAASNQFESSSSDEWDEIYNKVGPDIHEQIGATVTNVVTKLPGYKLNDYVRLVSGKLAKQGMDIRDPNVRALIYWYIKFELDTPM